MINSPTVIYRVRRLEGNISTDDIIPARYKHMYTEPADLAAHLFENKFPEFVATIQENDVIVCDTIFGIGSSREQAVTTMLASGIKFVLSPAFGRIFFRNAWNLRLCAIEVETYKFKDMMYIKIDLSAGVITSERIKVNFIPPSDQMKEIVLAGGIIPFTIKKIAKKEREILKGYNK